MLDPRIAQRLGASADWQAVQDHIEGVIDTLDRAADIDTSDDRACAIEVAARKLAAQKLRTILAPFTADREPPSLQDIIKERESDTGIL